MQAGARGMPGVCGTGCYYFEATVLDDGLCRLGWSTRQAELNLGMDEHGFGYGGTGKKAWNRNFADYGEPFGRGDVIGCYLDLTGGRVFWSKNGKVFQDGLPIPKQL